MTEYNNFNSYKLIIGCIHVNIDYSKKDLTFWTYPVATYITARYSLRQQTANSSVPLWESVFGLYLSLIHI